MVSPDRVVKLGRVRGHALTQIDRLERRIAALPEPTSDTEPAAISERAAVLMKVIARWAQILGVIEGACESGDDVDAWAILTTLPADWCRQRTRRPSCPRTVAPVIRVHRPRARCSLRSGRRRSRSGSRAAPEPDPARPARRGQPLSLQVVPWRTR
jgi:hypothetical protein